jgi:hypothetical protein
MRRARRPPVEKLIQDVFDDPLVAPRGINQKGMQAATEFQGTELERGMGVGYFQAKLANSLSESKKLEQTYVPIQVEMVRSADEARRIGRRRLRQNKTG